MVWDHAGTGTVRSRDIHQQIGRAEKRLEKLNIVEAARLTQAGTVRATATRSCQEQEGVGEAKLVAEEGARVGKQLAVVSAEDQALVGASVPRRGKRASTAQLPSSRQTRAEVVRHVLEPL